MTAPHADQIINGYLARLEAALAPLPLTRRDELLEDVRGHIAEARSALTDETDAELLTMVDRLGDPSEVAAEELGRPAVAPSALDTPESTSGKQHLLEILAIVFLLIFWPVGVVLLWISDVWTTREKLIGTLVPPGGYLGIFLLGPYLLFGLMLGPVCESWSGSDSLGHTTSGTNCPPGIATALVAALAIVIIIAVLVSPIFTAVYLGRRLKRRTAAPIGQGGPARLVG
jgi:hypothetical protein